MRLISATKASLTHTAGVSKENQNFPADTHSLYESKSRCGSWSCWHIVLTRCVHLPTRENQILEGGERKLDKVD